MKLIVGLGNPGKEYENTRHNVGYFFVDKYALENNIKINKKKFNSYYGKFKLAGEEIILLKPMTFMNLSGLAIIKYIKYFKIKAEDLIIIHDDLDIPFGHFKLKSKGSSGGHNGLKSIEEYLQTNEYKRLKIGISNNKNIDTKDYVLGRFSESEKAKILLMVPTINEILEQFIINDFEKVMSKYNIKNE